MIINDAIRKVLQEANQPLSIDEIYNQIVSKAYYSFNAKDPKAIVRIQVRRHCAGVDFPTASPKKFFILVSKDKYFILDNSYQIQNLEEIKSKDLTLEESLQEKYNDYITKFKQELLQKVYSVDPEFFEQLVLDLLKKLGYGKLGEVRRTRLVKDGGIDGIITEDKLGLEKICVQAKKNDPQKTISAKEIRAFAGSLKQVNKGVFITTAKFSKDAIRDAEEQQSRIALIDGESLVNLILEYRLGIEVVGTFNVFRINNDYFEI